MSLDRKDLRLKLDAETHAALSLLADADDVDLSVWAERVLVAEVRKRLHAAMVVAKRAERLGIAGIARDCAGTSGNGRE